MKPATLPAVSVLVPAYRPNAMLVATLESLAAQTHPDVHVHVSLDHAPDHVLPQLPNVPRLRLHAQSTRRGWVGNVNWLLGQVQTPCFLVLAHDDRLSPGFLQEATAVLDSRPEVMVVHGETRHYGVRDGEVAFTPAITGNRIERILEFVRRRPHTAEMGWRGVVRSSALAAGLKLRTQRSDGMFSNTLWVLELLALGESEALRTIHYAKFTDPDMGLSRAYHLRSLEQKSEMLADNLACLVDVLDQHGLQGQDRHEIVARYADWLLSFKGTWSVVNQGARQDDLRYSDARPHVARFIAHVLAARDVSRAPGDGTAEPGTSRGGRGDGIEPGPDPLVRPSAGS